MCFFIDKYNPDELIAEKNIKCYKTVRISIASYERALRNKKKATWKDLGNRFTSLVRGFRYRLSILYYTGFKIDKTNQFIDNGFHSFINKTSAIREVGRFPRRIVIKCIIPKGSAYYINPRSGEYVSNRIKIIDIVYTNLNLHDSQKKIAEKIV